jgi:hypothetical protein
MEREGARRGKLVVAAWGLGAFLTLAMYAPAMAQRVVAVYFEDLGFGSAMSYVFEVNSATGAPIGIRTPFFPQFAGTPTSFAWHVSGNSLILRFATTTDVIQVTGYDSRNDLLYFTRRPSYWAGCRSPYVPAGIPRNVVSYLCSLVGVRR